MLDFVGRRLRRSRRLPMHSKRSENEMIGESVIMCIANNICNVIYRMCGNNVRCALFITARTVFGNEDLPRI